MSQICSLAAECDHGKVAPFIGSGVVLPPITYVWGYCSFLEKRNIYIEFIVSRLGSTRSFFYLLQGDICEAVWKPMAVPRKASACVHTCSAAPLFTIFASTREVLMSPFINLLADFCTLVCKKLYRTCRPRPALKYLLKLGQAAGISCPERLFLELDSGFLFANTFQCTVHT